MAINVSTYDDLLSLVEDLNDDSEREAQDVTDYLDSVNDALRELQASLDTAEEALEKAAAMLEAEEIEQDDYDQIESYVDDIRDRESDARQEIRNVAR